MVRGHDLDGELGSTNKMRSWFKKVLKLGMDGTGKEKRRMALSKLDLLPEIRNL